MRRALTAILAVFLFSNVFAADEIPAKGRIVKVGLFKNGLAFITQELKVPGPGTYLLEDVPEPVHGTWEVRSDAPIETRVTTREVTEALRANDPLDFQKALAGKQITIHFREGAPAAGKVEAIPPAREKDDWNRTYERPRYDYGWYGANNGIPPQPPAGRFLILQTDAGRTFIDTSTIVYVQAEGKDEIGVKRRVPTLLVTVGKEFDKPATIAISYLSKGMAWAPNYRVNISDPKTLSIEQCAVIKNELADIDGAEVQLISGFPSMQFAHVLSPLSPHTNWATFFQQINQHFSNNNASLSNVAYQQGVASNDPGMSSGLNLGATPEGEGVDVNYHSIGPRTLKEGDSLALNVAQERSDYERIVEWLIPDTRNEFGAYIEEYQRHNDPEKYEDAAWDALRFKNPFKFPMTTAPATVIANDRFAGQQMSFWVNSGEETCLRVTKALSVRTRSIETEDAAEGHNNIVNIGGVNYRKARVKGELTLNNHRKEDVKILIRRNFSGDLVSADGEPKKSLREEGVFSVNARNELLWTLALKSGEEKTLNYQYTVLIRH